MYAVQSSIRKSKQDGLFEYIRQLHAMSTECNCQGDAIRQALREATVRYEALNMSGERLTTFCNTLFALEDHRS